MTRARTTHVETLRLCGAGLPDAPGLRLAVSAWLGAMDLHPPGLSPSALLVVRRLLDPMPQRCNRPAFGTRLDAAWTRAVRNALDTAARRAARPENGRLPPSAEAICFADQAEWMACLALDIASGMAHERWWWRAFLQRTMGMGQSARLAAVLTDSPEATPAALAHLTTWHGLCPVLHNLSPPDAARVLAATAEAHEVALPEIQEMDHPPASDVRDSSRSSSGAAPPSDFVAARPWDATTQAAIPTDVPSRVHIALAGVALTLHRRPSVARSSSFAAALTRWGTASTSEFASGAGIDGAESLLTDAERSSTATGRGEQQEATDEASGEIPPVSADEEAPPFQHPGTASKPSFLSPRAPANGTDADVEQADDPGPLTLPRSDKGEVSDRSTRRPDERSESISSSPDAARGQDFSSPSSREPDGDPPARDSGAAASREGGATAESPSDSRKHAAPDQSSRLERRTHSSDADRDSNAFSFQVEPKVTGTELGGVLYLVNLMTRLKLPGVFEDTLRLASTVGAWGVLEAVARGLLGPDEIRFDGDGIWTILAHLDNRTPDTPPGEAFSQPEHFGCPPSWINESGGLEGSLYWSVSDDRLRAWTHQYLVADRRMEGMDPTDEVECVARRYSVQSSDLRASAAPDPWHNSSGPEMAASSLAWWTARVVPFLHHRLTQALDLPQEADLTETLFAVPGVLHLSSMHVDGMMPLDAVSLPVRLAGLDRNPGWKPSFGRVVLFHYE